MPDEIVYPVLKNAPIVEAIAYFRFASPVREDDLHRFRESIVGDFPSENTDFSGDDEKRFVYASSDEKRFVRVGVNDFAYHKLAPYGDGNDFRKELRILWEGFRTTYPALELNQIALRAINRIEPDANDVEEGIENSTYFHTFPVLGDGISSDLFSAFMRIGVIHPEDNEIKGVINWAAQPPTDCRVAELSRLEDDWDGMDAIAPSPMIVTQTNELINQLDRAMRHANLRDLSSDCSATPTGGIGLSWRCVSFHLWLLVEPELPGQVIVVEGGTSGSLPERYVSVEEATAYAVGRLQPYHGR